MLMPASIQLKMRHFFSVFVSYILDKNKITCAHARFLDTSSRLLDGINKYRSSLNLSSLTENTNADCLAEQIAQAFKGQDCSNSTGSDTVPGTEEQFPNFPNYLSTCHLDAAVTRDGSVMPACVPGLVPDLVLSNYTKSQYNENLNSSNYVGVGIADEGDWVVVVLATDTPTGNYAPAADATGSAVSAAVHHSLGLMLLCIALFSIS